jgi:hypothetical protein
MGNILLVVSNNIQFIITVTEDIKSNLYKFDSCNDFLTLFSMQTSLGEFST